MERRVASSIQERKKEMIEFPTKNPAEGFYIFLSGKCFRGPFEKRTKRIQELLYVQGYIDALKEHFQPQLKLSFYIVEVRNPFPPKKLTRREI